MPQEKPVVLPEIRPVRINPDNKPEKPKIQTSPPQRTFPEEKR